MTTLDRARKYISALPHAVSGAGGHASTFLAAVALVKGFALPDHVALDELRAWNTTHADPPWTDADLRHKIRSAAKADRPLGYLLGDASGSPTAGSYSDKEANERAAKRKTWPEFTAPKPLQLASIAALRKLPTAASHLAAHHGLLKCATVDGHRAFIIREGNFAQARRFDGHPFERHDGTTIKAKNLPGSQGAFIGRELLGGPGCPVLLVEGAVGLLEAIAAAQCVDADCAGWSVMAATSASARFDAVWLDRLKGRRVRIVPDPDAAGREACAKWTASLRAVGCTVDAYRLPDGTKDLGDLIRDPERHRPTLEQIFTL